MKTYNIYKDSEIEAAKKERRNIEPCFSITCENVGRYVNMLELKEDYKILDR